MNQMDAKDIGYLITDINKIFFEGKMEVNHDLKITHSNTPFPHVYVENMYNDEELEQIFAELDYYQSNKETYFLPPTETGSATKEDNKTPIKNNVGFFLDHVYNERKYSKILQLNRRIFDTNEILCDPSKRNLMFSNFYPDKDWTLISYYENGGEYKEHRDKAVATACTWFFKYPKKFTGGDISFPDFKYKLKSNSNCMVVFPSFIRHKVSTISMKETDEGKGLGRYCMTQFMHYK